MLRVSRRIQFCAGHRLIGHEGHCRHVHGHNYVVRIIAEPLMDGPATISTRPDSSLDSVGRVVDFSVLKEKVGGWIEEHWDHSFIANRDDVLLIQFLEASGHPYYVMDCNPTAENMAAHLLRDVCPEVLKGVAVRVVRIELDETENCTATADFLGPV